MLLAFFKSLFGRPPGPEPEVEPPDAPVRSEPPPPAASSDEAPKAPRVDVVAIYEAAGVSAEDRKKVAKAQELLRTLPANSPIEMKRHIVEAAFKAFDIPTSKIVSAASREIDALNAFIEKGEDEMKRIRADCVRQIAELEAKISEAKASMARSLTEQEERAGAASEEILKVQPVVEFFRDAADDAAELEVQVETTQDGT